MNTNYEDDSTQMMGEEPLSYNENTPVQKPRFKASWKKVARNGGIGLFIGGAASALMGMTNIEGDVSDIPSAGNGVLSGDILDKINNLNSEEGAETEDVTQPDWAGDDVQVASGVNDDMSFDEAFATARQELGPGGVFEWHGGIYGAYYADEWDQMSPEEHTEYQEQFNWDNIEVAETQPITDDSINDAPVEAVVIEQPAPAPEPVAEQAPVEEEDDDLEIIHVEHTEEGEEISPLPEGDPLAENEESTVEVLGVVHNQEDGVNLGHVVVDGQEVVLVDVDGDMEFDAMAVDLDGDGQISENEVVSLEGDHVSMDHLEGLADNSLLADGGAGVDINGAGYEG
jgi:hypothetical protein